MLLLLTFLMALYAFQEYDLSASARHSINRAKGRYERLKKGVTIA